MAPLNIGILSYPHQAIDSIGPIDVLTSATALSAQVYKQYAEIEADECANVDFDFHHIGVSLDPVPLTGGVTIVPSCTIEDAPKLDVLILGGPDPATFKLDPRFAEYIRKQAAAGTLIFTNCSGSIVAAMAGVLDGKKATVNHFCVAWAKEHFPKVEWTNEVKWVVDGNLWTAAGAVAGMDMVSHWLKETYGNQVIGLSSMALDFEPRDVNGVAGVFPKRYDGSGKQVSTHEYKYHASRM